MIRLNDVLVWAAAAFGCWLVLILLLRRLRLPEPVAWAAILSWIIARLGLWVAPLIVHLFSLLMCA
jgi:hypothetical protein